MLLACAILAVGLAASLGSALLWHSSVRAHDHQVFQTSSTNVSETLKTLLQRDADLVTTLRAVLTMQPHMSATRFDQWLAQLKGRRRQAGGLGTTVVEAVQPAALGTFQARRAAEPRVPRARGSPAVRRCQRAPALLPALGRWRGDYPYTPATGRLLQGDWCNPASPIGSYLVGAATTRHS